MNTFHEWIHAKRPKTLADVLDEKYGTIRGWASRNVIPRDKWPDILKAYPEVGLNDLLRMEAANSEPDEG